MAEIKWDGPHSLQIDSYATGTPRAHTSITGGELWLEVTDGSDWWRAKFPAPWVAAVAPAEPPAVEADALIESIIDAAEDWTKDVIEDRCAVNIRVHLERAIAEFRAQSAAKGKP